MLRIVQVSMMTPGNNSSGITSPIINSSGINSPGIDSSGINSLGLNGDSSKCQSTSCHIFLITHMQG